jgi:Na+/H+-dicarboxylate symporter
LFIAQVYGIELTLAQQATMLLILLITSKGIAGVPRASLVVIAATLAYFDLPEAGLVLILRSKPDRGAARRTWCNNCKRG